MIGTILSLIAAIILIFYPAGEPHISSNALGVLLMIIPMVLVGLFFTIIVFTLTPLQSTEHNSTPHLFGLLKKDKHLLGSYAWMMFFAILSILLAIDAMLFNQIPKNYLLAAWIFILGISLDVIYTILKRMISYLNPFDNVLLFTQKAQESIMNDKDSDLFEAIDSLTEIAVKAEHKLSVPLCNQALQEMQNILRHFLSSSKSISHVEADIHSQALGIKDRISYTLFYLLDRIAIINDIAIEKRLEQVLTTIVTVLGKMTIHCAKLDLSLVNYPVHFLNRSVKTAMEKGMYDIGVKATLTLIEVSKTIIEEVDYTYGDLKDPFFSIINCLEEITRETFLHDKSINLKILTQPFRDLKEFFKNPKVISHRDTSIILQDIDRVLGEYDSLELVMKTIPPIPEVPENEIPS